jgi:hypothetical protein
MPANDEGFMFTRWIATAALMVSGAAWSQTTITFDNLPAGTVLSNQYSAQGVVFSPNAFTGAGSATSGRAWATLTDMTIVSSTGPNVGGLGNPPRAAGNVLRSFSGWAEEDGDPSFLLGFSTPVSWLSIGFASVDTPQDVTLWAYSGNHLVSTVSGSRRHGGQFTLSLAAASITHVAVRPGSFDDWVAVDNIVFAPVPETSTYAMMAFGLALLGVALRRRRPR